EIVPRQFDDNTHQCLNSEIAGNPGEYNEKIVRVFFKQAVEVFEDPKCSGGGDMASTICRRFEFCWD
ncbi:unnamed protein product, partial [Allacma fusca]